MNLPLGVRDGSPSLGREEDITIVHFVETSPSVLREMPWITLKENPVTILLCLLSFLHFLVTSLLFIPSNQTLLPIFVSHSYVLLLIIIFFSLTSASVLRSLVLR